MERWPKALTLRLRSRQAPAPEPSPPAPLPSYSPRGIQEKERGVGGLVGIGEDDSGLGAGFGDAEFEQTDSESTPSGPALETL